MANRKVTDGRSFFFGHTLGDEFLNLARGVEDTQRAITGPCHLAGSVDNFTKEIGWV